MRICRPLFFLLTFSLLSCVTGCAGPAASTGTNNTGGSGGGTSVTGPSLSTLTPSVASAGSASFTLNVAGSNFTSSAKVNWNGSARTTTYVNSGLVRASITSSDIANAGTASVTVTDTGGTSNAATFTITGSTVQITSLSPNNALQLSTTFTLQVSGANFKSGATIVFGGTSLTTNFQSASSLSASVSSSLLATVGTVPVYVINPGTGSGPENSNSVNFTVNALPAGSAIADVTANDIAGDPVRNLVYASVPSTAAKYGNSIAVIDATTGAVLKSFFVGSEPNRLAISDDGTYLYVALDGSSQVSRYELGSITSESDPVKDFTVSLGADSFFGPNVALDLAVSHDEPNIWAVTAGNVGVSPAAQKGVTVYDGAIARPKSAGRNSSYASGCGCDLLLGAITFGKDSSTLIGANNESTGFDMYVLKLDANGVVSVKSYGSVMSGFGYSHIQYVKSTGYVYSEGGQVVNPETGAPVGRYSFSGPMVADGTLKSVFFVNQTYSGNTATMTSFDMDRFTPLNVQSVPNVQGGPLHMVRWGVNGIAFNALSYTYSYPNTNKSGKVYLFSGSYVKP